MSHTLNDTAVLGWDRTGRAEAEIRRLVEEHRPPHVGGTVERLSRTFGDYRLVAVYLHALASGDPEVARLCERIAVNPTHHYHLGSHRFAGPEAKFRFTDDLEEVLVPGNHAIAHIHDRAWRPLFESMLSELGRGFGRFVENQHEVPGPNARIRQGVVRSWFLPDGTRVASKRANPLKPGRFEREQRTIQRLTEIGPIPFAGARELRVAPMLATVRAGGQVYSISRWVPGTTLESALLGDADHRAVLQEYRALLDALLDHGVLWGDLSPRNILRYGDVFHLVDFEKSELRDSPIPVEDRVVHCRGQIGVEELGVLCSPGDVQWCLRGYFDPDAWDLYSAEPLTFPQRPEVADVLRGRGVHRPSLGRYNRTDREIFDVRSPDSDPATGERRYPGLVNFRVEHYLSCAGFVDAGDYDRKTTEVLIAGRAHGCFDDALQVVTTAVDEVERQFVVAEFRDLLNGRNDGVISMPEREIHLLRGHIDELYSARDDGRRFSSVAGGLS